MQSTSWETPSWMKHEGLRVTWRGSRLRLNASLWLWPMGGPLTLPLRDPCVFGRWHGGGGSGDAIRPWWRRGGARAFVRPQLCSSPLTGCAKGRRGSECPRNLGSPRSTLGLRVYMTTCGGELAPSLWASAASFPKATPPQVALSAACLLRASPCQGWSRRPEWS